MELKQTTSKTNGRLWGSAASDWAAIQEPTCLPVYQTTFDRLALKPGTNYLDAGCGAGLAAQLASERGAVVSGLDAAENLLTIARQRVPAGEFRVGELEQLPFPDSSFDLVTGFNSFQYAANPTAALAEAKRVAKPGSHVVVMTWGRPEGMEAASLVSALRPLMPPPPPGAPGPFALSDEAALRAFAVDLETAVRGLRSSGVAARTIENSSVEAVDEANATALKPFQQPDGSYRIGVIFRCLITRA